MTAFVTVFSGLLGLIIGSFLNVVIWRVPRKESVVQPPSHCPRCQTPLAARDNVPVLSWLLLRGRCRTCALPISARYPLVELLTGALFAGFAARLHRLEHGWSVLPAYLVFAAVTVALAFIDYDTKKLPNVLTLPMYGVGVIGLGVPALVHGMGHAAARAAEGGAALYAFYFILCYATAGKGLGFGDVKLAGVLGMFLGWIGWKDLLVGALGGIFVGGVVAAVLLARGMGRKAQVPFGPFLVVGAYIGILAGHPLAHIWLGSGS